MLESYNTFKLICNIYNRSFIIFEHDSKNFKLHHVYCTHISSALDKISEGMKYIGVACKFLRDKHILRGKTFDTIIFQNLNCIKRNFFINFNLSIMELKNFIS